MTDHHSLGSMLIISPKILEEGTLDPANDNQVRRTYLASGISLDVSDDPKGSDDTWTSSAGFPDQDGVAGI